MTTRHTLRCAVYALLVRDNYILMSLRKNTGYMDGFYSLPAGHLERGERLLQAVVREAHEEIGLDLQETDLTLYHVMHRQNAEVKSEYIDFYFKVAYWIGEPINSEPEKCEHIKWFPLEALPHKIVPSVKAAIEFYKGKLFFSELM